MRAALQTAEELAAIDIVERLRAEGHQAYLAGGCVRDLLLNRRAKDFDVATSARPEAVLALFPKTYAVGAHFGVVMVMCDKCGEHTVTEVATFRSDGAYTDGRHPAAVRFSDSPEEDVQRRDFTINGMLLDPVVLRETGSAVTHSSFSAAAVRRSMGAAYPVASIPAPVWDRYAPLAAEARG